jgi:hypothetical protein
MKYKTQTYYDLENLGVIARKDIPPEERSKLSLNTDELPDDVFWEEQGDKYIYWRYPEVADERIYMSLAATTAKNIRTLKNIATWFLIISIISAIAFTVGFFLGYL